MKKTLLTLSIGLMGARICMALDFLPDQPPVPANNPITPEKVSLGKLLYFDPRLSLTQKVSCNSCHDVSKGGEDQKSVSVGINGLKGKRSAPTVWNAAYQSVQFWDGRAPSLEEQAKGPLVNPIEMGMKDHQAVIDRIAKISEYQKRFKKVFGTEKITIDHVAQAIATYERTLITPDSPYDRFAKGDQKALSAAAQRGLKLTQTVGCVSCHNGPMFSGPSLPVGTGFYMKFPTYAGSEYETKYRLKEDLGRFNVTHAELDKNMWRVPTWRNIELTAPYFHNGSVKTLDEAVRVMAKTQLNRTLQPNEVEDIVAFLKSLTGKRPTQKAPSLPQDQG